MRVVFVSDLETMGGAAIAASRIANGLARRGVKVTKVFGTPSSYAYGEAASWESLYAGLPRPAEVVVNGLKRLQPGLARRIGRGIAGPRLLRTLAGLEYDVLHVHAIHNSLWNHETLAHLPADAPTVWTFYDHWPFSPQSYLYKTSDGSLARLKPDGDDAEQAMRVRRDYFRSRSRLRLIAPSRALAASAREGLGLDAEVIYFGMSLDLFTPIDPMAARRALSLPEDAFVIGYAADYRGDPIKGFEVLQRAVSALEKPSFGLAVGSGTPGDDRVGKCSIRLLGRIDNPRLQAIVYSAADVFVVPSLEEGFGQVAMESIACGTPIVASNVGGLPEVGVPGETGWLFPPGDADALRRQLEDLMADPSRARRLRPACRAYAEQAWPLERQADDYIRVYSELLQGARGAS
jgi:glycosyltransferase involved in cell wall biosynthesis